MNSATVNRDQNLFTRHCAVVPVRAALFLPVPIREKLILASAKARQFVEVGAGGLPVKSFQWGRLPN